MLKPKDRLGFCLSAYSTLCMVAFALCQFVLEAALSACCMDEQQGSIFSRRCFWTSVIESSLQEIMCHHVKAQGLHLDAHPYSNYNGLFLRLCCACTE